MTVDPEVTDHRLRTPPSLTDRDKAVGLRCPSRSPALGLPCARVPHLAEEHHVGAIADQRTTPPTLLWYRWSDG